MFNTTYISDKLAMSISTACVVHCFFAPAIIIFSYGVSSFTIDSEIIHYAIILLGQMDKDKEKEHREFEDHMQEGAD